MSSIFYSPYSPMLSDILGFAFVLNLSPSKKGLAINILACNWERTYSTLYFVGKENFSASIPSMRCFYFNCFLPTRNAESSFPQAWFKYY